MPSFDVASDDTVLTYPLTEHPAMLDIVYIALIVAFFAATAGLVRLCARLQSKAGKP
jgi:hypothetical protein